MNTRHFDYFISVANTQSLTRSARELQITQPSLSKAISKVEDYVGVQLFTRSNNRIRLNEFGRVFYEGLCRSSRVLQDGVRQVRDRNGLDRTAVAVAIAGTGMVDAMLLEYYRVCPEAWLLQQYTRPGDVRDALERGLVDFALTQAPVTSTEIRWTLLQREEFVALLPPGHPYQRAGSLPLSALAGERFVVNNYGLEDVSEVEGFCMQAGFTPRIIYRGQEASVIGQVTAETQAVCLVPVSAIRSVEALSGDSRQDCYVRLSSPDCSRALGLARIPGRYLSAEARQFLTFILGYYGVREGQ